MVESFNQSVEAPDIYFFLAIIWILAFFFNIFPAPFNDLIIPPTGTAFASYEMTKKQNKINE